MAKVRQLRKRQSPSHADSMSDVDSGPACLGRSPLLTPGHREPPERVPGWDSCRLTWMVPTGQVPAEAADTHTSPAGLCLGGLYLQFMPIQKQDQCLQGSLFNIALFSKKLSKIATTQTPSPGMVWPSRPSTLSPIICH